VGHRRDHRGQTHNEGRASCDACSEPPVPPAGVVVALKQPLAGLFRIPELGSSPGQGTARGPSRPRRRAGPPSSAAPARPAAAQAAEPAPSGTPRGHQPPAAPASRSRRRRQRRRPAAPVPPAAGTGGLNARRLGPRSRQTEPASPTWVRPRRDLPDRGIREMQKPAGE
jgi:hypothetical protein